MRKSWARNVRVAGAPGTPGRGEKTGVIVGWGGPGGSKDRVFFGTVRYDADDHEILGAAPFSGTGGPKALFAPGPAKRARRGRRSPTRYRQYLASTASATA